MTQAKKTKQEQQIIPTSELSLQLKDELKLEYTYKMATQYIKNQTSYIFDSYLNIGSKLREISDKRLYELDDYESIYDYALSEFNLAKTTVHNVMSISEKFTDENGRLLEQYRDLSFSSLVELVSIDQIDLDNYQGLKTVQQIRTRKSELKISKKIAEAFENSGDINLIIERIKAYPIHTELNNLDARLIYEVLNDGQSLSHNTRSIVIGFQISNITVKKANIPFKLIIDNYRYSLQSGGTFYWSQDIKVLEDVDIFMNRHVAIINDKIKEHSSKDKNNGQNVKDSYNSFSTHSIWNNFIGSMFREIHKEIGQEYFYDYENGSRLAIYKHPMKEKTNLPLLMIEYPNDITRMNVIKADGTTYEQFENIISMRSKLVESVEESIKQILLDTKG